MRGCGRSVIPALDFRWSLDLLADDLFAVADSAGLQQFHLVGESIGGTIALAAAIARPDRSEVRCPTLLLHPDGSPFIPVPVMAELHRLLPNAELNVIGHARHGLPYSHAARCSALLRTFLDSHWSG